MEEDDPFYTHDEFGRPLDPDSIARRQVLKELRRMSATELFDPPLTCRLPSRIRSISRQLNFSRSSSSSRCFIGNLLLLII